MQRRDFDAELVAEAAQRLRRQRDLGQQDQRLRASRETGGDGGEIDIGLAAAGHAIKQERREAARADDRIGCRSLFVVEGRSGARDTCLRLVA